MGEDAEGPDVGGGADAGAPLVDLGPQQLRRGVVGRGEGGCVGVRSLQLRRHVEVGQSYRAVFHQQDVGGLQIAVHPARVVQLVQALADLGQQGRARLRLRFVFQYGVQGALGQFQHEDGGAVQLRVPRIVDRQGVVHADQPGRAQAAQQLHLPLGEFAHVPQLSRGAGAGGQELQGGPAGHPGVPFLDEPRRVHGGERAGGQSLAHLPRADPVALRDGDGVGRLPGHRTGSPAVAASTTRSSSRTRSKRSASETSESFLPLTRRPGSAVSGPGRSRSLRAR